MATLTFLGTGTSSGVPVLGCQCTVCTSSNSKDHRLRTSALLETTQGTTILFDCGPDFRQQMLNNFVHLDAIFITHEHYDHIGGLDDLRPTSLFEHCAIYAEASAIQKLKQRLPYCFSERKYLGVPQLDFRVLEPNIPIQVKEIEITPFRIFHGQLPIVGFRAKSWAYITDMKTIAPEEEKMLRGIEHLVVNALRTTPHHSHLSLSEAISFVKKIEAKNTYLTHFSHQIGLHDLTSQELPPQCTMAYDGLQIAL